MSTLHRPKRSLAAILTFAAVLISLLSGCGGAKTTPAAEPAPAAAKPAPAAPAPKSLGPVTFALDWVVAGRHTPYYVALEKGFYKDAGLDVTIVRGYGSSDSIKQAAAGKADFAFGDTGSLLIARTQSIPVKAVAMVYSKAPFALYSLAETGIKSPKDLEGKTIAAPAGDSVRTLFPAFAKANGIDPAKVKWLTVEAAAKAPSLFAKKADVITEFALATPVLSKQAAENKLQLNVMLFADHGLSLYSNAILASETTLKEKPEHTKAFVQATLKGLQYTLDNPDDAAAIMVKKMPELNLEIVKAEIKILKDLVTVPAVTANGLGYIDEKLMTQTADVVSSMYNLQGVKPADAYTNEFLKK